MDTLDKADIAEQTAHGGRTRVGTTADGGAEARRLRRLEREAEALRIVKSIGSLDGRPVNPDWKPLTPQEREQRYIDNLNDDPDHSVYFLYCAGHVKIGYTTTSFMSRADRLANGTPLHTFLLLAIQGGKRTEFLLHRKFAEHRRVGEWFVFHQDIRDFVAEMGGKYNAIAVHQAEFNHRRWVENEARSLGLIP